MKNNTTDEIVNFINSVGINVVFETLNKDTFLPGITIRHGHLIVDMDKLNYPGDLLHEAGHVAVTSAGKRSTLNDNVDTLAADGGNEMAAIAWSYAACKHVGIDPSIVFHESGYKGSSKSFIDNFNQGRYFGVPLLQCYGMTYEPNKAAEINIEPYPAMINWLSQWQ